MKIKRKLIAVGFFHNSPEWKFLLQICIREFFYLIVLQSLRLMQLVTWASKRLMRIPSCLVHVNKTFTIVVSFLYLPLLMTLCVCCFYYHSVSALAIYIANTNSPVGLKQLSCHVIRSKSISKFTFTTTFATRILHYLRQVSLILYKVMF